MKNELLENSNFIMYTTDDGKVVLSVSSDSCKEYDEDTSLIDPQS